MSLKTDLMAAADEELQLEAKQAISQLIDDYSDVFFKGEYDLGCTGLMLHSVDTGDHKPIRQPLRRQTPATACTGHKRPDGGDVATRFDRVRRQ